MGKNNGISWLSAVRRAFRSPTREETEKRSSRFREDNEEDEEKKRGKIRWILRSSFPLEIKAQQQKHVLKNTASDNDRMAMATTDLHCSPQLLLLSKQQHYAAITIQSIFRGYLARKARLALKGVVKMQALIRGHIVRSRAKTTLKCMQSLLRVQAQVCDQRRRLSYEELRRSNACIALKEIQALVEQARQFSLAHQISDEEGSVRHRATRRDKHLCIQRDPMKTLEEIGTCKQYISSPAYSYLVASPLKPP